MQFSLSKFLTDHSLAKGDIVHIYKRFDGMDTFW